MKILNLVCFVLILLLSLWTWTLHRAVHELRAVEAHAVRAQMLTTAALAAQEEQIRTGALATEKNSLSLILLTPGAGAAQKQFAAARLEKLLAERQ